MDAVSTVQTRRRHSAKADIVIIIIITVSICNAFVLTTRQCYSAGADEQGRRQRQKIDHIKSEARESQPRITVVVRRLIDTDIVICRDRR